MTFIKKRCDRCGKTSMARPRQTRCRRHVVTGILKHTTYLCWGHLRRDTEAKSEAQPKPKKPELTFQEQAAKKLAHARSMVSNKTKQLARLAKTVHGWEKKAAFYAKRASMTDAEVAALRERASSASKARGRKSAKRGIAVTGGLS